MTLPNLQKQTNLKDWQLGKVVIILLSGKAGVGKSTVANYMREIVSLKLVSSIESFAENVKLVAYNCFGWDGKKDDRGRKLLQDVGRIGRDYDEDIWVRFIAESILSPIIPPDVVIIDDWRFPNERDYLKEEPLFDIKTVRIYAPEREILRDTPRYGDISETSLPDSRDYYDYWIDNSGSLDELIKTIQFMAENIFLKEV